MLVADLRYLLQQEHQFQMLRMKSADLAINQNVKVASNFICVPDGHTLTTFDQLLTGA